jgi:hypothetical protein
LSTDMKIGKLPSGSMIKNSNTVTEIISVIITSASEKRVGHPDPRTNPSPMA